VHDDSLPLSVIRHLSKSMVRKSKHHRGLGVVKCWNTKRKSAPDTNETGFMISQDLKALDLFRLVGDVRNTGFGTSKKPMLSNNHQSTYLRDYLNLFAIIFTVSKAKIS